MAGSDGAVCEVVRADTDDLRAFVEGGDRFADALRGVFDGVAEARSRTMAAVGGSDVPSARVARLDGGHDPLAELMAEARLANAFVLEIADALVTDSAESSLAWAPAEEIDAALADVGLSGLGFDRSMSADQDLVEIWAARRELGDVLAGLDDDLPDHLRAQVVGLALEEWLDSIDGSDPDRLAAVSQALLAEGVDLRAGLDDDGADGPAGTVAAMLVTQGILLWPGDHGELVDDLTRDRVAVAGGERRVIEVVVDALDLDQSNDELNAYGIGLGEWHRASQPWVRNAALVMLIDGTMASDGTISVNGQRLVDDVLDRYPEVVGLADDTWHDVDPTDRYHSTVDGRACRVWPAGGVRDHLARALAAPNDGLTGAEYRAALALDALDAELGDATGSALGFNQLLAERMALVDDLAGGDPAMALLIDQAMARGLTAAEALRLARFGGEDGGTDDRVRRLRVIYPTTPWGDPVDPGLPTDDAAATEHGLPFEVARSLAVELAALQEIQAARYAEGHPIPEAPLTADQIELVRRYGEVGAWFYHRFAWGWPGGAEGAADHLSTLSEEELERILPGAPDGFADLLDELVRPENQIVWDLMAGAADNDTFLGPDGTFRRPDGNGQVASADAQALLVQLALLSAVGPHHGEIDANGDGIVHEDEVERWLDWAEGRPGVPPALVDQVRLGANFGLGQDTFGWEEFGELVGWIGLAAAVTATVVYSGGTAAPLWVQAGLVGLAAVEAYAFYQADDGFSAGLAAVAGVADLAAAIRLVRLARNAPVDGPIDAIAGQRRQEELIDLARRSELPALNRLADEASDLDPTEFLDRYQAILDAQAATIARDMVEAGADPKEAIAALRELGVEGGSLQRFVERPGVAGSVADSSFAQNNVVRPTKDFSEDGQIYFSGLAGYPIHTVQDLVTAIERGDVAAADIVIDYVILDGHQLILNTRTSTALRWAGIPQHQWVGRDRTGIVAFIDDKTLEEVLYDDLARAQLKRNGLSAEGSPTLGVDQ